MTAQSAPTRGAFTRGAVVVVLAATLSIGAVTPRMAGASDGPSVTTTVPVVKCATGQGADSGPAARLPATMTVRVAASLTSSSALYVDRYDVVRMVGPKGWRCVASLAADGGEDLVIYLSGSPSPGFFHSLTGRSRATELTVQQEPACYSCCLALACPFFAAARALITSTYASASMLAACRRPPGEVITDSTPSTRYFTDGPHVVGHAYPSGGPLRSLAVAYFGAATYSYVVSCTLPAGQRSLCRGALGWFVAHHRSI